MSNDLLASVKDLLTPDLIGKAASMLGDPEPAVSKGMSAVFPVLLGSLANRSSDAGFASTLYNLVRDPANDGSLLGNVGSLLAPGAASSPMGALGGKLLGALFGNNLGNLASSLGGYAGVKPSSASSMFSFAAPLVLSLLGKAVKSGNLSLSSLVSLLTGQKSTYAAAVPGPLSRLESYFAAPAAERYVAPPPPPPEPKSSIWRWLLPLLIALALLWLLSRCMGGKEETTMTPAPTPAPVVEPTPAPEPMPAPMAAEELPLANYYFEVDQSELPVAREGSLEAVIAYLMANPTAVAAVSGYHDPTGDAAHNEELARQRAQTVKDAMMAAGVPESQIDMVKPIVSTGSGDMAEARRVEVSIRR
jgi:outer membrane protein OmpA-like peptidoglycan-associated protein